MDEILDLLASEEASDFMDFVDDYHTACENVAWGWAKTPFIPELVRVMQSAEYYDA